MKLSPVFFGHLKAKINRHLFIIYWKFRIFLLPGHTLNILFSNKPVWSRSIKKGFRFSGYKIVFKDFTVDELINADIAVALTIKDVLFLSKHRSLLAGNPVPVPETDVINLCNDKYLLNQALITNGFGKYIPAMDTAPGYPYFLKKAVDEGGRNSYVVSDKQQQKELDDLLVNQDYFIQESIPGTDEYALHILVKGENVVCSLNIKHVFSKKKQIKGKDKPLYSILSHCPYLELFSSMLRSIQFEGLCCIDYKIYNNQPWIIEINPRCGGSLSPYLFYFVDRAVADHFI